MMRRQLTLIAVGVLAVFLLTSVGCQGPEVPDVVGMRQADAVRALQGAGFLLGEVTMVKTDQVPLGMIAAQRPVAGERARKDTAVDLAVSFSDGQRVMVPTVTGLARVTAEGVANTLGLTPVVVEQYNDDAVAGEVFAQVPEPSGEVDAGSTLVMVVSEGPAPGKAGVPDVVGDSRSTAEGALDAAGFDVEAFEVFDSSVAKGDVIAQVPEAGKSVLKGSTVQIAVSLGKGTGVVKVPAVTGESESGARAAIEAAGLKARRLSEYTPDVAKGRISAQFPGSGTTAAKGSEVLIVVSKGAEPADTVAVPDVMGMAIAEATSVLQDAGFEVVVQEAANQPTGDSVFFQFPRAAANVTPGSEVLIVVGVEP